MFLKALPIFPKGLGTQQHIHAAFVADIDKESAITAAKEALGDKLSGNIIKEIYVPGKIVNIVAK